MSDLSLSQGAWLQIILAANRKQEDIPLFLWSQDASAIQVTCPQTHRGSSDKRIGTLRA